VIRFVAGHWDKPITVTENGISTSDDKDRLEFIQIALAGVHDPKYKKHMVIEDKAEL